MYSDKQFNTLLKQYDIDIYRIRNQFRYGRTLDYLFEAKNEEKNKLQKFIHSIVERIRHFIEDLIDMFHNMGAKDRVSMDEFLKSDSKKMDYEYDVALIQAKVEEEFLKGRKLIQAISKGTGVKPETVAKYVDECNHFLNQNGHCVLTTAIAYSKYNKATGSLKKLQKELTAIVNNTGNTIKEEGVVFGLMDQVSLAMSKLMSEVGKVHRTYNRTLNSRWNQNIQEQRMKGKNKP